jgi:hypothetical protein
MIAKIGFFIFVLGVGLLVHTANLWISSEEKILAKKFKTFKKNNITKCKDDRHAYEEARFAYLNVWVVKVSKFLMLIGLLLVIIGYFFG